MPWNTVTVTFLTPASAAACSMRALRSPLGKHVDFVEIDENADHHVVKRSGRALEHVQVPKRKGVERPRKHTGTQSVTPPPGKRPRSKSSRPCRRIFFWRAGGPHTRFHPWRCFRADLPASFKSPRAKIRLTASCAQPSAIGRIEKNKIEPAALLLLRQKAGRVIHGAHLAAAAKAQFFYIGRNDRHGLFIEVVQHRQSRATANCFEPQIARARKQIQHRRARQAELNGAEHRFLHAIERGAGLPAPRERRSFCRGASPVMILMRASCCVLGYCNIRFPWGNKVSRLFRAVFCKIHHMLWK